MKIHVVRHADRPSPFLSWGEEILDGLREKRHTLTCGLSGADVVLYGSHLWAYPGPDGPPRSLPRLSMWQRRALFLENDSAAIPPAARQLIAQGEFDVVLSNSLYTNLDTYNLPDTQGAAHIAALAGGGYDEQPVLIPTAILKTFQLAWGFETTAHMSAACRRFLSTDRTRRPFDLHYAAYADYTPSEELCRHREAAFVAVNGLMRTVHLSAVLARSFEDTRALDTTVYWQTMCQSKVVISPWGWGEYCYRDYEALAAGATLVRPATPFSRPASPLESLGQVVTYQATDPGEEVASLRAAIKLALAMPQPSDEQRRLALTELEYCSSVDGRVAAIERALKAVHQSKR